MNGRDKKGEKRVEIEKVACSAGRNGKRAMMRAVVEVVYASEDESVCRERMRAVSGIRRFLYGRALISVK